MARKNTIKFNKKQFFTLLKAAYIADWIANAHDVEMVKNEYSDLQDYIFSKAKEYGFDEFVDHDKKDGDKYYPTRIFEEDTDVHEKIKDYEEESFWQELIDRMAGYEVSQKLTPKELEKLERNEFFEKLYEAKERLSEEFEKNGIKRLSIIE
ncbi:hypothetical protein GF389_05770 [Candidatus Dojkabacteria bacterium]|nr:hypothetical protein [Candidatus Dojkabacteria bacterium]